MKLATLLLSGAVALGSLVSADVLAHEKGRGHDRDDHPRHEVHRHKHYHHHYKPQRHYDRDHRRHDWKGDRWYGKRHWKHDHKAYRYDYRPYRHDYRYKPRYRDSWYGIHLFFGG